MDTPTTQTAPTPEGQIPPALKNVRFPKFRDAVTVTTENGARASRFDELRYSISQEKRREILLKPVEDFGPCGMLGSDIYKCVPPAALIDTAIKLFNFVNFREVDYPIALKYLFIRNYPDLDHLLENCKTSGDLGCYLGKPNLHRLWVPHALTSTVIENIALGAALIDGMTIEGRGIKLVAGRVKKDELLPEASWVFRAHYPMLVDGKIEDVQFARIGLNFHFENGAVVASITNIQGMRGAGKKAIRHMKSEIEWWTVTCLTALLEELPPEIKIIRGIPARQHPSDEIRIYARQRRDYQRELLRSATNGKEPPRRPQPPTREYVAAKRHRMENCYDRTFMNTHIMRAEAGFVPISRNNEVEHQGDVKNIAYYEHHRVKADFRYDWANIPRLEREEVESDKKEFITTTPPEFYQI